MDRETIPAGTMHCMEETVVEDAHAFLRRHSTADLRFDENIRPIKYVILPDGRLAAPVMVAMLESFDTVLFVPEFADESMEVLATLAAFQERGVDAAAADRWRIYHGDPPDVRWAYFTIDTARFSGMVIDGPALMRPNPLAGDEPSLCRWMNAEHVDGLRALCARHAKFPVDQPLMVGIDPGGVDVRAAFDVVRIAASQPMTTSADARRVLIDMMAAARG